MCVMWWAVGKLNSDWIIVTSGSHIHAYECSLSPSHTHSHMVRLCFVAFLVFRSHSAVMMCLFQNGIQFWHAYYDGLAKSWHRFKKIPKKPTALEATTINHIRLHLYRIEVVTSNFIRPVISISELLTFQAGQNLDFAICCLLCFFFSISFDCVFLFIYTFLSLSHSITHSRCSICGFVLSLILSFSF